MGTGNVNARLMVVGQAPGRQEDAQGRPFIGPAGQLLNRELAEAGLDRAEMYVTNVAKCYPPGDRPPTRTEMKICGAEFLSKEVDAVKPELTILLGNAPLQGVLGMSGITSKANAIIEKNGQRYLPIIHPAAALRDPTYLPSIKTGLLAAKRFLDGEHKAPVTTTTVIDDDEKMEYFLAHLNDDADIVSIDIETPTTTGRKGGGLDIWAPDWRLDCVGFGWEEGVSWVLPVDHPESVWSSYELFNTFEELNKILKLKRIVGHNVKFDLQGLRKEEVVAKAHFDTFVASHLLDENGPHGLKALARQYLGAELYEDNVKRDGSDSLETLTTYNGQDVDYTLRLYHIFREQLIAAPKLARIFKFLSMPALNALIDIERRGFPVDLRRLRDRNKEISERIDSLFVQMLAYVPTEHQKGARANRSKFLLWLLFDHLNLPVVKETAKNGQPAVDEEVLLALRDEHPIIPLLMEYRRLAKLESTYTRKWIELVKVANEARLYPSYNLGGTVTGRLSSNMQQVPRDGYIRGIIGAPRGKVIIEADFSQIELRIAAMVSHDPTMMAAYTDGEDLHMLMAMAITGKPKEEVTKEERSRAKPVSFGFLYGMGPKNFVPYARAQFGIEVTEEEAKRYRQAFFGRFPRLLAWHESQRRKVEASGYVDSPIGRRRRLPAIRSMDKEMHAEAERQAINSPVQSFASDLTIMAMTLLENNTELVALNVRPFANVHDSILFEAPEGVAEQAVPIIKQVMETLPVRRLFGFSPPVPIVADVSVVSHWGDK